MSRYNPKIIEPKWQAAWAKSGINNAVDFDDSREKYVMLTEFPYPSGSGMHIGHMREYTLGDIMARRKRMLGFNVLFPMGYDAFGLPTENYAIKNKITPQKATQDAVVNFQSQLEAMGFSFDWSRSFKTSDPDYYKWTQWLFLRFFKAGLAYQAEIAVNWCPFCKTGLSNEEVVNGRHERCDTLVEKKLLKQWVLKITKYADRLIEGLDKVDYPSRIADQQISWIGRSVGLEIKFPLELEKSQNIKVFTTRADTIYGATFIVLAPEHPMVNQLTTDGQKGEVNNYVSEAAAKTELERQSDNKDKSGVFSGSYALNPATKEKIPIWIAEYILMGYGTGAIMAVPAHDERDFAFAQAHDLPIKYVISPDKGNPDPKEPFTSEGIVIGSGKKYDGQSSFVVREKISADLIKSKDAKERINYRMRDWIFSRQRYWGEPIPIIHCPKHGPVAVKDADLPVLLPEIKNYEPSSSGESPLAAISDWVNTTCPECGEASKRETDTMPNWAGSSWYYLRYFDPHNDSAFASSKKLNYWGSVDLYLGGMEHTTLHLLYSRFWHQFFYDEGLVPTPEPYLARRGQGIILAADGSKMSKSKGNVVDPKEIIDSGYGADALRLAITFLAPYDQTTPWSPETLGGTYRFLQRVWTLTDQFLASKHGSAENSELKRLVNSTSKQVGKDLEHMSYNTAIAAMMECVNGLYKLKAKDSFSSVDWQWALETLTKLLAPFAPHIAEELWQRLGGSQSVHLEQWPGFDEQWLKQDRVNIAVQINGKLRGQLTLMIGVNQDDVLKAAKNDPKIQAYLSGSEIKRVVYVQDKLLSLVL
ncbi:MAG: leucine--tRNA ligase [Candidatus Saccharimonadales bacterium]